MIKRLFLAICLCLPTALQAQIILDSADMGSIGQSVIMKTDTGYTGGVGSMGPSQLWNFSSLSPAAALEDTVRFLSPASIPGGPTVPNANVVMQINNEHTYVQKTATKIDILAINLNLDTLLNGVQNLTPPLRYLNFPGSYMNNHYSYTSFSFTVPFDTTVNVPVFGNVNVDSVRITVNFNQYDTLNGYGTLHLPSGIEPALRQHSRQVITVTAEAGATLPFIGFTWVAFPLPIPDQYSSTYRYFGKGHKYPLLEISTDSAGNVGSVNFQDLSVTAISQQSLRATDIVIYPNPATERVTVNNRNSSATGMQWYGLLGQKVQEDRMIGIGETAVEVSNMAPGIYLLRFTDVDGNDVGWKKIIVQ